MSVSTLCRFALGVSMATAMLVGCSSHTEGNMVPPIGGNADALPHHHTFRFTGTEQTFKVPSGVNSITVDARGAAGAPFPYGGRYGIKATAAADVPVRLFRLVRVKRYTCSSVAKGRAGWRHAQVAPDSTGALVEAYTLTAVAAAISATDLAAAVRQTCLKTVQLKTPHYRSRWWRRSRARVASLWGRRRRQRSVPSGGSGALSERLLCWGRRRRRRHPVPGGSGGAGQYGGSYGNGGPGSPGTLGQGGSGGQAGDSPLLAAAMQALAAAAAAAIMVVAAAAGRAALPLLVAHAAWAVAAAADHRTSSRAQLT